MSPAPGTVEPQKSSGGIGWLAAAVMGAGLAGTLFWHNSDRIGSAKPRVDAVITAVDGTAAPKEIVANRLLRLSSSKSTAGNRRWFIDPPSVQREFAGDDVFLVAGPADGKVTVRLMTLKSDDFDEEVLVLPVLGSIPSPNNPDPVPGPTPQPPKPSDFGDTDAAVRKAAADFFRTYVSAFREAEPSDATTFQAVGDAIQAKRTEAGTVLGKSINALLHPLRDATTDKFIAPVAAKVMFARVANSLAAGLNDAQAK